MAWHGSDALFSETTSSVFATGLSCFVGDPAQCLLGAVKAWYGWSRVKSI